MFIDKPGAFTPPAPRFAYDLHTGGLGLRSGARDGAGRSGHPVPLTCLIRRLVRITELVIARRQSALGWVFDAPNQ